jgi:hypothetical protein
MLNCYCQLSSSVIFRQYGVSKSECKIDRPRPGLSRLSPRPHTKALGMRLITGKTHFFGQIPVKLRSKNFSHSITYKLEVTIARKVLPHPQGIIGSMRNLLNKGLFL